MVGCCPLHTYKIHDFGGLCRFSGHFDQLSHLINLPLNRFVSFVDDFHHIRIQQINEKIGTQQNNNGRKTNTHEFVLLKDRRVSISYRRTHRDNQQRNQSVRRYNQDRNDHIQNQHTCRGEASSPACSLQGLKQSLP